MLIANQTLSRSSSAGQCTQRWTHCTSSHHYHILSTVSWPIWSGNVIGGRTWFGRHVQRPNSVSAQTITLTAKAVLPSELRNRIDRSTMARDQIAGFRVLNIDFFPRESHLVTFRDPWSFPTLYHPACNHLVRKHMDDLAQKVRILNISRSRVLVFSAC